MRKIVCFITLLLALPLSTLAKKGYEIVVNSADTTTKNYILWGYKWGERIGIDTVKGRGKIIFTGKSPLPPGQYLIEEMSVGKERLSLQFITEGKIDPFRLQYTAAPLGVVLKKGDTQNQVYLHLQEFLRHKAKKIKTTEELSRIITDFYQTAKTKCPGSLLEYLLEGLVTTHQNPSALLQNFPYSNPAIINSVFGKEKVDRYLKSIELNPTDTLINLTTSLIQTAGEKGGNELQQRIAETVFDYFQPGHIMGQEAIAVRIAEQWFLNGKLPFSTPDKQFLIKTFTGLNKQSLIGMQAPELNMTDTLGNQVNLSSLQGEYTILYFYTHDCVTCQIEVPKLMNFLNGYKDGVLNVYAVYAQEKINPWKEYIQKEFELYNPFINWTDVYDPEFESGFHLLYNVIATPQMFLLDKNGVILGRNLKTKQLEELLGTKNKEQDDLHQFFSNFFSNLGDLDTTTVQMGIDAFYTRSIHNPVLFREIFGELYNFLRLSSNYLLQDGAAYLAKKYILEKEELWNNPTFMERIRKALVVFNMNPLGKPVADISLEQVNGSSIDLYNIQNEYKVLYFYKPNCGTCSIVTPALGKLYEEFKNEKGMNIEFVAINTSTERTDWLKYIAENGLGWLDVWAGEDNNEIFEKYYLSGVPVIYLLHNNTVIAKDITDIDLKKILQQINNKL